MFISRIYICALVSTLASIAWGADSVIDNLTVNQTATIAVATATPRLKLSTPQNIYAEILFNTWGADQVTLRASSYGLNIVGTNPRLAIGAPDANRPEALYVNGASTITNNLTLNGHFKIGGVVTRPDDTGFIGISGSAVYGNDQARIEITGKSHPTLPSRLLLYADRVEIKDKTNGSSTQVIIGNDPGTTETLRVGGSAKLNGSLTIGGGGTYGPGCVYSDANWGMVIRELQSSPAQGQFLLNDASGAQLLSIDNTRKMNVPGGANIQGNVGIGSSTNAPLANLHIDTNNYASIGLGTNGANVWYVTKEVSGTFNIWQGAFGSSTNRLNISTAGNVGIGVAATTSKLAVAGTISASEVKVTATPADYVFADEYKLRPLSEVETQVKANRHLPGVPSASEQIQAGSVSLSEMQRLHLEKIEELTLYAIEANKQIAQVTATNAQLSTENKLMRDRLDRLEKLLIHE